MKAIAHVSALFQNGVPVLTSGSNKKAETLYGLFMHIQSKRHCLYTKDPDVTSLNELNAVWKDIPF